MKMIEAQDYNCYEFMRAATVQYEPEYGDFRAANHMGKDLKRSEFFDDIESFTAYLQLQLKLKRGDCISIVCPTNVESLVGFYSANRLGVITNFVHPLLPTEQIEELIVQSKSKAVMILDILVKDHIKMLNKLGLPVILCRCSDYASPLKKIAAGTGETILEAILPKIDHCSTYWSILHDYRGKRAKVLERNGSDIAAYLNGGGTTGKAKTIKMTGHAMNAEIEMLGYIDEIKIPGEEAEIIILPFFHAFGLVTATHMALCNAACVIPLMRYDSKLVVKLYKKYKVVGLMGIPNMFKKLKNAEGFDGPHLADTRMMFVGGDDCSPAFMEGFNDMLDKNGTKARLRQGYGLTEVCAVCCVNTNWVNKDGSIGKPLHGIRMECWDDNCKQVPTGEVGEICISGPTIMDGYLTDTGEEHAGLYFDEEGTAWVRSGDLGYVDEDGFFYFAGRKKRLIIISGYNVYPVDIENLIDKLPYVMESCAIKGTTDQGKPFVKLYVSLKKDGDEEKYKEEIIQLCKDNLDQFSVPRAVEFRKDLPHTPLEKVDFMALQKEEDEKNKN